MADDKKSDVSVIDPKIIEYFNKPESERVLKETAPEFSGSANVDEDQKAARLRQITEEAHKKIDEVFERAWEKNDAAKIKQATEETTKQLHELVKDLPPSPKKGDVITRRQIAEAFARSSGDDSEEGVQKQLKFMDWYDEGRPKPLEKGIHIAGSLFVLGGFWTIVMPMLGMSRIYGKIGPVMVALGVACWLVSNWKQSKRIKKLPPPQQS